jgi:hypothetical protein
LLVATPGPSTCTHPAGAGGAPDLLGQSTAHNRIESSQVPPRNSFDPRVESCRDDGGVVLVERVHGQLDVQLVHVLEKVPDGVVVLSRV